MMQQIQEQKKLAKQRIFGAVEELDQAKEEFEQQVFAEMEKEQSEEDIDQMSEENDFNEAD